ncbi:RNaseH domain-containing protein [Aureimonas pseudogalii]|uniref:Uncharacterized protein n=1 Tax=Aureimonas pseudogalii TaxID=1744844 RepID=A0A7W6H416_9HYPH|nr:RNaseH domain-containing protein [Aureimonas pseudogalii]MBB3997488.1 hypothetical protein [Aureimonas pseudogalii]
MIYVKKPSPSNEGIEVLGLSVVKGASEHTQCMRLSWLPAAVDAFAAIASAAKASGDAAGNRLPFATLRALLSAGLPSPLYVASDLSRIGQPARDGGPAPFAECAGGEAESVRAVTHAVRAWTSKVLGPWAAKRGLPDSLVAEVSRLASAGGLSRADRRTINLLAVDAAGNGFPDMRDAIHSALARRVAGTELFPGMGPVRVLVRSRARENWIDFVTFPRAASSGWFSMRARLTVETLPGADLPFVRLDVSRMRWCPEVPTGLRPRQKRISSVVFGPDGQRAVSFDVPVSRGAVQDPENPAYALSALRAGVDPGTGFAALVSAGPRDGAFVGVPYAPGYEPAPAVASGSTELDHLDCHAALAAAMAGILEPIEATSVPAAKRVSRTGEDIPALKAANILGEIARSLGHNEIDDEAIAEAWQMLHGVDLPRGVVVSAKAADEARKFDELREANTARARQAFGDAVPPIVVLSASAAEGAAIADVAATLFAGRMRVEHRLLPEGVHGPRKALANADQPARGRYESRVSLWKPFAEGLLEEFGPCRVLVNAPRFMDDPVNKIAGRVSLARFGDCNVQYLDKRGNKADEWFYRIQAAVLDLMFGHSGIVSPVAANVADAFPDAATRPRSIVGVSVVSQNRTFSRSGASFFLSVSIDVASGRTSARVARPKDGTLEFLDPLPFFDLLKAVAAWDGASIGNGETAKADFQAFMSEVVGGACDRGENPLVMVDAAHARTLWASVSNKGWAGPHVLDGRPLDIPADWPGARLVRIEDSVEPAVVTRKSRTFAAVDPATGTELDGGSVTQPTPTLTEPGRLVRLPGPADNYVSSGHLDGQQKIAKGLSVYRTPPQFRPVPEADRPAALDGTALFTPGERDLTTEPYKLPGTIGILVAHCLPGDDPDRVAALCHALREGFGHTRSPVRMPAPLFQTRKVAEYIPAYVLDDEEDAEDAADPSPEAFDDADVSDGADVVDPADASGDGQSPRAAKALDDAGAAAPTKNPLLLLAAAGGAIRKTRTPMINEPASATSAFPLVGSALAVAPPTIVPEEILAKVGDDDLVRRILVGHWVGPLPAAVMADGFFDNAVANSSVKSRQLIKEALAKIPIPFKVVLPPYEPRDGEAFLRFMHVVANLSDGLSFIYSAIETLSHRGSRRWIFNSFYEGFYLKLKILYRKEQVPKAELVNDNPGKVARMLQASGDGLVARRYFVLECFFAYTKASNFASAAAEMAKEFGDGWDETAAFCARMARYRDTFRELNTLKYEWLEREKIGQDRPRVGSLEMPDFQEAEALEVIPDTPAPAFVDASWLKDKISLTGAFRSRLHSHRATFNDLVGDVDFWPDDKPSTEAMTERVARLFSVPEPILGAVSKRDLDSLFRPFYRKIESMARSLLRGNGQEHVYRSDWEDAGTAPVMFYTLAAGGYRETAADFAAIRAIDNPSWSLECVLREAGDGFAEVAEFVRNRRRAALWFAARETEENPGDAAYGAFVARFDQGEPMPKWNEGGGGDAADGDAGAVVAEADDEAEDEARDKGEMQDGEEEPTVDMTVEAMFAKTSSAAASAPAGAGPTALDSVLRALELAVGEARVALASDDLVRLDRLVLEAGILLVSAKEAADAIPRLVSNDALLARAGTLAEAASAAAERVGEVDLPTLPVIGMILPASAERAAQELDASGAALEGVHGALAEIGSLSVSLATAKLKDHPPIQTRITEWGEAASRDLNTTVGNLRAAAALLEPESRSPETGASKEVRQKRSHKEGVPSEAGSEVLGEAEVVDGSAIQADTAPDPADAGPDPEPVVGIEDKDGDLEAADGDVEHSAPEPEVDRSETAAEAPLTADVSVEVPEAVAPPEGLALVDADRTEPEPAGLDEEADTAFDEEALDRLAASAHEIEPFERASPREEFENLDAERVNLALDRFVETGSDSYAYHLALAAEMEGLSGVRLTSDEAKVAAVAGHLNHVVLRTRADLASALVTAGFRGVEAATNDPDPDRSAARLLPMMPLILELGVFFPAAGAGELLRSFEVLPNGLGAKAHLVFESVARIRHANLAFSRSMLANVATEIDCTKAMVAARSAMIAKAEQCTHLRFNHGTVTRICATLARGDGLVGKLHSELQRGVDDAETVEAVAAFAAAVSDRGRVVAILNEAEGTVADRVKGIVGAARDRFVQFFGDFHAKATAYLEAAGEADAAKAADRPKIRDFAREIANSVNAMVEAVEAAAGEGPVGRAAGSTAPKLKRFADLLSGDPGTPAPADMYQACHAAMALIPSLEFGRSWLPTPYDPARIVDILCEVDVPPLPVDPTERDAAFDAAVRQRIDRSSFVGAGMLLDAARFFGVSEDTATALADDLEVNLDLATRHIVSECAEARASVERVIRFGSLRQSADTDTATNLVSRIDNIEAVRVPVEVDAESRAEELDDEGIYDVSVAIEVLEEVKEQAAALLHEPRDRLLREIDGLAAKGADLTHVERLRQLCQKDDLLTAEEFIDETIKHGKTGKIAESRSRNARFDDFSVNVLPRVAHLKRDVGSDVAAALRAGDDFEGFRFSALTDARRSESAGILDAWRDLFRRIMDPNAAAHLGAFLDRIGMASTLTEPMGGTPAKRSFFWADFKSRVPLDQESLLLYDFGSRTNGQYRVVVSPSILPEATLTEMCAKDLPGVILLVGDLVTEQQRRAFHVRNLEARRRVLLVDAASLYYTLAEQTFRPLTLLELGQPYSYVFPFDDWGKSAVPPEMFVGRKDDITQIMAADGSCIVYGGRRMGKTAILQHLRNERNDPENGLLVGFVDAQHVGKLPAATRRIWSDIAAALPDVFGNALVPTDPKRIADAIRKWLSEDTRRRVVLLIDECDEFVVADAHDNYSVFRDLQTLMTDTKRRFKFVLSGLSDVTRLVQTGNPPLKQIAANPRRIGSLTGPERKDAEDLVLRPLAAIGISIERTDVWRILSHANYYPILIQTYAQHLLDMVAERGRQTQKPLRAIGSDLVSRVLEDRKVREAIKKVFDMTLLIDQRYRLIAYVVANLALRAESDGRLAESFSTREIRDHALAYWEAGFQDQRRFSLFDDLLDEMEGLGIVRRVGDDRWTLRSTAVMRLLGSQDEVATAIEEFKHMTAPVGFDPRSHRRVLAASKVSRTDQKTSPLTLGQEQEILKGNSRATIVVGPAAADIALVPAALRTAPESFADGDKYEVRFLSPDSVEALAEAVRAIKPKSDGKVMAVVAPTAPWTAGWVRVAIQAKNVAKGDVRVIFVGSAGHAASVAADEQLSLLTAHVGRISLEPWSTTFFQDTVVTANSVALSHRYEEVAAENGGWNGPMWQLFRTGRASQKPPIPLEPEAIGLSGRHGEALRAMGRIVADAPFTITDVDEYLELDETMRTFELKGRELVEYGEMMGVVALVPGKANANARSREYALTGPAVVASAVAETP